MRQVLSSLIRAVISAVFALALTAMVPGPATAENPCVEANPATVASVRGTTFIGVVRSVKRQALSNGEQVTVTFDVTKALVGDDTVVRGFPIEMRSGPCDILSGLVLGKTYLVSTSGYPHRYFSENVAAWQLDGDQASYVVMHPSTKVLGALRSATTLEQVFALVAPGDSLPPTDALAVAPANSGAPGLLFAGSGLGAAAGIMLLRRRQKRRFGAVCAWTESASD